MCCNDGMRGANGGDTVAEVDVLVAVAVAVDGQQHGRFELAEAVDHRLRAELGRGRRPDRPEARGGQEGGDGLGQVRHVGDDAVALADAEPYEAGRARATRSVNWPYV